MLNLGGDEYVDRSHWDDSYYGLNEEGEDLELPEDAKLTVRLLKVASCWFARAASGTALPSLMEVSTTISNRKKQCSAF